MPILHQAASEIIVFMLMAVETFLAEFLDVSMAAVVAEDMEEEVEEVEDYTSKEVVEGAADKIFDG